MLNHELLSTETPTRERFEQLADQWQLETRGQDVGVMSRHPAHQEIVAMGEIAVPWILESLKTTGGHWFMALHQITGAAPVPPKSCGRVKEMTKAWLDWGRQQGYFS